MSRSTVPLDMHTMAVVAVASVASTYYTLLPWIEEQKTLKAQNEYHDFQKLKTENPTAAQAYIDNLRLQESWIDRKLREQKEKHQLYNDIGEKYIETRAIYGTNSFSFSDDIYKPRSDLPFPVHFPTSQELDTSELVGKSLSLPSKK